MWNNQRPIKTKEFSWLVLPKFIKDAVAKLSYSSSLLLLLLHHSCGSSSGGNAFSTWDVALLTDTLLKCKQQTYAKMSLLPKQTCKWPHGVSKSQKKSHSTLRAKRATFNFWVDKNSLKMPKMAHFGMFRKHEDCNQSVLPDVDWTKMMKNAKVEKFEWVILGNFQTMWTNLPVTSL